MERWLASLSSISCTAYSSRSVCRSPNYSPGRLAHTIAVQGLVPGLAGMHDVDDYPRARTVRGLVVYRYDSPLFFANAENFRRRALGAVDAQREPVDWFVLNAEANVEVDITALDALEELRKELTRRGIVFAMARVKRDLLDDLDAYGLTTSIGPRLHVPDPADRRGRLPRLGPQTVSTVAGGLTLRHLNCDAVPDLPPRIPPAPTRTDY